MDDLRVLPMQRNKSGTKKSQGTWGRGRLQLENVEADSTHTFVGSLGNLGDF
jgi:hypothetical protein